MTTPDVIANSLRVRIVFDKSFDKAQHEFTYELEHVADAPSDEFYWDIPNAPIDQVGTKECIQEGPKHGETAKLGSSKIQHPDSPDKTRLIFKYKAPLEKGDKIKFKFSYDAPTSAEFKKRFFVRLGNYVAPFHHSFQIKTFVLQIILPREMSFIDTIPYLEPPLRGPQIEFQKTGAQPGEYFSHHLVFCQERKMLFSGWAIALAVGGFGLHAFLANRSPMTKWFVGGLTFVGLSVEAIWHTAIVGAISGLIHSAKEFTKKH